MIRHAVVTKAHSLAKGASIPSGGATTTLSPAQRTFSKGALGKTRQNAPLCMRTRDRAPRMTSRRRRDIAISTMNSHR